MYTFTHIPTDLFSCRVSVQSASVLRSIRNQKELVEYQVEELNNKADILNVELARLLKQRADLEENIIRLHQEGVGEDRLRRAEQQRDAMQRKIDSAVKKVTEVQKEIKTKHGLLAPH